MWNKTVNIQFFHALLETEHLPVYLFDELERSRNQLQTVWFILPFAIQNKTKKKENTPVERCIHTNETEFSVAFVRYEYLFKIANRRCTPFSWSANNTVITLVYGRFCGRPPPLPNSCTLGTASKSRRYGLTNGWLQLYLITLLSVIFLKKKYACCNRTFAQCKHHANFVKLLCYVSNRSRKGGCRIQELAVNEKFDFIAWSRGSTY